MHTRFALCALALASLPLMGLGACKDATAPPDNTSLPAWVTVLIHEQESQPVANPPAFCA
jgi:hypothetical protein